MKNGIVYHDSIYPWKLSIGVSGGLISLNYILRQIDRFLEPYGFKWDFDTNFNLFVYRHITVNIYGKFTDKWAYKFKNKFEDFVYSL